MRPLLLFGCLVVLAGCGGGAPVVPVSGTVTIDNKPLAGARVTFIPEKETAGLGGIAETGTDGKYVITGSRGEPGLVAGKYKVTVRKGQPKRPTSDGGAVLDSDFKDELPAIYSDPNKTTLSYTVSGDGKPIDIQIDSKKR